jgi:hypothetical protein
MEMTKTEIKEAFHQCEYPFYKNLTVKENEATCILYSIHSDFKIPLTLSLLDFDSLVHQISLHVIQMRSQEIKEQQQQIMEQLM